MASTNTNPPAPNLASILIVKRKLAAKNNKSNGNVQSTLPTVATGAHSNEKINYRQDIPVGGMPQVPDTTTAPTNTTEPTKVSRKTKQLEVELLDKKMEEIDRKQEEKTNEAIGSWKGFDSFNYGFTPDSEKHKQNPVAPVTPNQHKPSSPPLPRKQSSPVKQPSPKQRTPSPVKQPSPKQRTPSPEKTVTQSPVKQPSPKQRTPSPKYADSPVKDEPRIETPLKQETRPVSPQKPIEKQLSAPQPLPRHSKVDSAPSVGDIKKPEQEQPKSVPSRSPPFIKEEIIPISSIVSNPQPVEQFSSPLPINHHHKFLPNIKHYEIRNPRNAHRSIQRSMDRYRFHVW